jgi:hypothetical protein
MSEQLLVATAYIVTFRMYLCLQKVRNTPAHARNNVIGFVTTECREGFHEHCVARWVDEDGLIVLCLCLCGSGRHVYGHNKSGNEENNANANTSDISPDPCNTVGYIFKDCMEGNNNHSKCNGSQIGRNLRVVCLCQCGHRHHHTLDPEHEQRVNQSSQPSPQQQQQEQTSSKKNI